MNPSACSRASEAAAGKLGHASYVALRLTGWLVINMACVLALWTMLFAALGAFTFPGTVLHLENFASRYVAADPVRRSAFQQLFWLTSAGLFCVIGVLRRHALGGLRNQTKENEDG